MAVLLVVFSLALGLEGDETAGRDLIRRIDVRTEGVDPLMDRAREGDEPRDPARNRISRECDRRKRRRRYRIERLFRWMKGWRRLFIRYAKLDAVYTGFIRFTLIREALRLHQRAPRRVACG